MYKVHLRIKLIYNSITDNIKCTSKTRPNVPSVKTKMNILNQDQFDCKQRKIVIVKKRQGTLKRVFHVQTVYCFIPSFADTSIYEVLIYVHYLVDYQ